MRLKKVYVYLLSFFSLSFLFSASYYMSYQHALKEFNQRAIERIDEYAELNINNMPTPMAANESNENDDSVEVGLQPAETIKPSTRYVLEIYDRGTDTVDIQRLNPPAYLVGLTKEEVEEYLSSYMEDLTLSEYNKGLMAYELVAFSDAEVTIRKSYDDAMVPYRYYVVVKNGFVVVYNSDLKSVYKYTYIEAKDLPEDDRIALSKGIYVNDLEELYSLLESYSS